MKFPAIESIVTATRPIAGWFQPEAASLIGLIDEQQKVENVTGHIFEIGVHHGKSAIFLSQLLSDHENIDICDLFGSDGNVSRSGSGDEEVFVSNMKRLGKKAVAQTYRHSSFLLETSKLRGPYRLFHIDGGHNTDEALNDLELASSVLHEKGVMILDDPFRVEWPGVTEALVAFLQRHPDFEAFATGFNKTLLCRKVAAETYRTVVSNPNKRREYRLGFPNEIKVVPFAGGKMVSFFIPIRYVGNKKFKIWVSGLLNNYPVARTIVNKLK